MSSFYKNGSFYHVFNKSIANYKIFANDENKQKFINTLCYYNSTKTKLSFSVFLRNQSNYQANILLPKIEGINKFLSYCIMPDHYHLLLKIISDNKLSKYIGDVENSFSRYFNKKNNRKGPLWQSRFKAVLIDSDEQMLHVSRYIHLNPTTSGLVSNPQDWSFSSYNEIISSNNVLKDYLVEISIRNPKKYQIFVENHKNYQRKLKLIRRLILEN